MKQVMNYSHAENRTVAENYLFPRVEMEETVLIKATIAIFAEFTCTLHQGKRLCCMLISHVYEPLQGVFHT